jgi:hypothetical protein
MKNNGYICQACLQVRAGLLFLMYGKCLILFSKENSAKFLRDKEKNKILIRVLFVYMAWAVAYSILRVLAEPSFLNKLADPRFLYYYKSLLWGPGRQNQ